jgi:hypothetical protein
MLPLFRMLEQHGLARSDAEAAGFRELGRAAQRCLRCLDSAACIRWLKWHGTYHRRPLCLNADYFDWLEERTRLS